MREVRCRTGDFGIELSGVRSHQPAASLSKRFYLQNPTIEGRMSVIKISEKKSTRR